MINWGKLRQQNRVKEVGIPWNEEENKAIREFKIPADYVRKGILTLKDYEEAKKEGITESRPREDVVKEAKELGVNFVPEVETETLEREIEKKYAKGEVTYREKEPAEKEKKTKEPAEKKPEAKTAKKAVKAKK